VMFGYRHASPWCICANVSAAACSDGKVRT
jgi:hypothetical protein